MPTTLDDLKARIRGSGLRGTAPRIAVLRHLDASDTPISHAEIADVLSPLGFDRATIYRNLTDMTQVGLLARVNLGENVWHFEVRKQIEMGEGVEHPHFVCVSCGAVSCLEGYTIDLKPVAGSEGHPTVASISEILIKGHCRGCHRTLANPGPPG